MNFGLLSSKSFSSKLVSVFVCVWLFHLVLLGGLFQNVCLFFLCWVFPTIDFGRRSQRRTSANNLSQTTRSLCKGEILLFLKTQRSSLKIDGLTSEDQAVVVAWVLIPKPGKVPGFSKKSVAIQVPGFPIQQKSVTRSMQRCIITACWSAVPGIRRRTANSSLVRWNVRLLKAHCKQNKLYT